MCGCQGAEYDSVIRRTRVVGRAKRKQCSANEFVTISGGNGEGVPPVPIPNTEVKPFSAESTWLDTAREHRSPPDPIFLSSSMAEHSAVNRRVVGSSPTWGAQKSLIERSGFFLLAVKDLVCWTIQRRIAIIFGNTGIQGGRTWPGSKHC